MALPLEGIRVVDWTIWQQGPVASLMLGDFGAEVIKIESREGDPGRGILRAQGLDLTDRPNFYFEANNRNKKSLAVDLKKPEGVEIVRRIADRADVFVQNFRKGVAARLGLDAATLRVRNPRLIYASATGYGPEGPESGAPSFDYLGLALQHARGMDAARACWQEALTIFTELGVPEANEVRIRLEGETSCTTDDNGSCSRCCGDNLS